MLTNETTQTAEQTAETEKGSHKISDEEFREALYVNYGLYAQTARYIEKKYGISYSRQAVQKRAVYFLHEITQHKDAVHDLAEERLFNAINQEGDAKLQYKASVFLLTRHNYGRR